MISIFEWNLEKNMHESEGRVLFEVFEKLTSVYFFPKLHKKLCYYIEDITRWREDMGLIFEW